MNLAARRSARQRENFVMRLGSVLVSAALVVSLVLEVPKAKAEALTLAVSGGVVLLAGYLSACGMTPYFTGSWNGESVARELQKMGQEFVEEIRPSGSEPSGGGGPSFSDWLGTIVFTVSNGAILFGKEAAAKVNQFAAWVASKYGTKPGMNVVYGVTGDYVTLASGARFYLCTGYDASARKFLNAGSPITLDMLPFTFSTGYYLTYGSYSDAYGTVDDAVLFCSPSHEVLGWNNAVKMRGSSIYVGIAPIGGFNFVYFVYPTLSTHSIFSSYEISKFDIGAVTSEDDSLSLDVAENMQQILDRLTALEEGQSVALDVGATQAMTTQEILQNILDAILAGDLAATAEVVDAVEEPVDPDPPVVPELPTGLDRLGAALTSRFPFSIPWDVYKGVKLLAAPAKAPYFEVDFLEPIGHLVGGWKGSTKIVLDMSEYEIIGQVCRWTSTIGFCLMLASGTKRLVWTA